MSKKKKKKKNTTEKNQNKVNKAKTIENNKYERIPSQVVL